MSATLVGALVGAAVGLVSAPYLARLTISVPDRDDHTWWRGQPAGPPRTVVTALTAVVLGALAGAAAGWGALLPALVALAFTGAPLTIIDFEHHRLPNRLVFTAAALAAALLALAAALHHAWPHYLRSIEGGAAVYAGLFLLFFISPRSFGFGDVKLGGVLGGYLAWFGWVEVYYGIFAGFLIGMVMALGLLATGKASMKSAMAFGPALIVGTLLVLAIRTALP